MTARANAVLLLAAALDGRAATAPLAAEALLPPAPQRTAACRGAVESLAATAALIADAHQATTNGAKNEAMRELLRSAGWQWAGAMLLGLAFLTLSRHTRGDPRRRPGARRLGGGGVGRPRSLAARGRVRLRPRGRVAADGARTFRGLASGAAVVLLLAIPALRKPLRCSTQAPSRAWATPASWR